MKLKLTIVALAGFVASSPVTGQYPNTGQLLATRAQLEELLRGFEQAAGSSGYSPHLRAIADEEVELIRTRLTEGDFQVGDQIILAVTGQTPLTNTFVVGVGRTLVLPGIPEDLQLAGLLRSELMPALTALISKYIRNPQIQVQTNIRMAVFGQVANPGYHVARSDGLVTDIMMTAGGPTAGANQKKIRIKRGGDVIWDGDALQTAIVQGRTLDQLNLRAGDELEIPGGRTSFTSVLGVLQVVPYVIAGVFALTRLF